MAMSSPIMAPSLQPTIAAFPLNRVNILPCSSASSGVLRSGHRRIRGNMKRRQFFEFLGYFSLSGLLWRFLKPSWQAAASEEHTARSVAALADLMFPGEGLPRATEVGVHRRVLAMPELGDLIAKGVAWLDKRAALEGAADFLG